MRKTVIGLILIVCMLFFLSMPSQPAEASDLAFISTNDKLLELSSVPYYADGIYYAPYWVFSTFGIYYSYQTASSTAILYSGQTTVYFDMTNGGTIDANDTEYAYSAVFRDGVVYVPVECVCAIFGLSWSYISGSEHGDILRIKNSSVVLSDKEFLSAAASLMEIRHNQHIGITEDDGAQESSAQPEQGESSQTSAPVVNTPPRDIFLSFSGLPGTQALDMLDERGEKASFFLSAQDVRDNPDMIRRISGSGHKIGALIDPDNCAESFDEVSGLLFEAAKICAVMVSSDEEGESVKDFAAESGLSYKAAGLVVSENTGSPASVLSQSVQGDNVRVICGKNDGELAKELLDYFNNGSFKLSPLLEVDNT